MHEAHVLCYKITHSLSCADRTVVQLLLAQALGWDLQSLEEGETQITFAQCMLTDVHWRIVNQCVGVLEPLYIMTLELERHKVPTAGAILPCVYAALKVLDPTTAIRINHPTRRKLQPRDLEKPVQEAREALYKDFHTRWVEKMRWIRTGWRCC